MKWCALSLVPLGLLAGATEPEEAVVRRGAEYAQARAQESYFLSAADAAGLFRKRPLVLDLRPPQEFAKAHLRRAVSVGLGGLFTAAGQARLSRSGRILVVASDGPAAVEAMVLLRMAGYDAVASLEGAGGLAAEVSHSAAKGADGKPAQGEEIEGSDVKHELDRAEAESQKAKGRTSPWILWLAAGAVVALLAAVLFYYRVVVPRKKAQPMRQARELLARPNPDLAAVDELLDRALPAGMPQAEVDECRFLLAWVKTKRRQYGNAMAVLDALISSGRAGAEALYLDLWLKVHEKLYRAAERRVEESWPRIAGMLEANLLAGIVYLEQGRVALAQGQLDRAMRCFERLRELNVLTDRVPKDLEDHEMALAIQTLAEGNREEAARKFEALRDKASGKNEPTTYARIGLLLCRWKGEDLPDVDGELGELVTEIGSAGGGKFQPKLVNHMLLWHAVSLLFVWLRRTEKSGLPEGGREALETRLQALREADPEAPDADLMAGLLDYYFASDDEGRRKAVALLRGAVKAGAAVPDAALLIQAEEKLERVARERRKHYLALLRAYLGNPAVPVELRRSLHEYLSGFDRYRPMLEDIDIEAAAGAASASVQDLAASCEMMEDRVRRIFRGVKGKETEGAVERIEALVVDLGRSREHVTRAAAELGKTGEQLMRIAGEALLAEEISADGEAEAGGD